jgi:hypothetical protein
MNQKLEQREPLLILFASVLSFRVFFKLSRLLLHHSIDLKQKSHLPILLSLIGFGPWHRIYCTGLLTHAGEMADKLPAELSVYFEKLMANGISGNAALPAERDI